MEQKDLVLETFSKSEAPLQAGDIVKLTGLERKEVDKAMKKLKEDGLIVSPKRCFWQAK